MNNTDKQYLDLVSQILKYGRPRKSRAGDTLGIFGAQLRFNLQEGFPLLTTKRVHFHGVFHELLWFLSGSTNIKYLLDNSVNIWNDDAYRNFIKNLPLQADHDKHLPNPTKEQFVDLIRNDPNCANWGELGYGTYGSTWVRYEAPRIPVHIPPRKLEDEGEVNYLQFPLEQPILNREDEMVGQTRRQGQNDEFVVLYCSGRDRSRRRLYTIQFRKSGHKIYNVRSDVIKKDGIGSKFNPSVAGVGVWGDVVANANNKQLIAAWSKMLDRCYSPKCKEYKYYGAKGVRVCNRWLFLPNFLEDAKKLPNYHSTHQIDKDYYSSNGYSPQTCVWLSKQDNVRYIASRGIEVTFPDGEKRQYVSVADFAREQNSNANHSSIEKLRAKGHKGFKFDLLPNSSEWRYPLTVNQISKVIDSLTNNPDSRRHIVNAWHPYWVDKCVLPPCHTLFQFHTEELTLNERATLYYGSATTMMRGFTFFGDRTKGGDASWLGPEDDRKCMKFLDAVNIPQRRLNCQLYQRSCDVPLGGPYNIASYALLTHLVAQSVDMVAGDFVWSLGDAHIYTNQIEGIKEQLSREPRALPKLVLDPSMKNIFGFKAEHIKIEGYDPHPAIKIPLSVGLTDEYRDSSISHP